MRIQGILAAQSPEARMILIGQYDSPFVRRVAVAMHLYGFEFEHRPWSVFGDAERLAAMNPLRRVPTLITDDGDTLIESGAILDWLDELAGPDRALIPRSGIARRSQLQVCALATGLADKAVSLVYEQVIHERGTPAWVERCRSQIAGVLDRLEADRAQRSEWWFGGQAGHADIAVACVTTFLREAHPGVTDDRRWPALRLHREACESMPIFRSVTQPFTVSLPAG